MKLAVALLALATAGCTSFHVTQTDTSPDRVIRSEIWAMSWFSSGQKIARLKAIQTDKTQSFGSDSFGQQGATNTVEALKALSDLVNALR